MVAVDLRLYGKGLLVLRTVVGLLALRAVNGLVAFLAVIVLAFFGTATAFALAVIWIHTIALADVFHDDLVSAFCATKYGPDTVPVYPNVPLRTNFQKGENLFTQTGVRSRDM